MPRTISARPFFTLRTFLLFLVYHPTEQGSEEFATVAVEHSYK